MMSYRRFVKFPIPLFVGFLTAASVLAADKEPEIFAIGTEDAQRGFIDIFGENLTDGDVAPIVTFGGLVMTVDLETMTDTFVSASIAGRFLPGDYPLTLTTQKGSIVWDLTIPAVGPQGEPGPQGIQGEPGPQGPPGPGFNIYFVRYIPSLTSFDSHLTVFGYCDTGDVAISGEFQEVPPADLYAMRRSVSGYFFGFRSEETSTRVSNIGFLCADLGSPHRTPLQSVPTTCVPTNPQNTNWNCRPSE